MFSKRNDHYMIIDKKKSFFFLGDNIYKSKCSNKITKKKNYETYIISSIIYNSI